MSLTLDEIKEKYNLFNHEVLTIDNCSKHIETIFKNNDLFLFDKMKRANLFNDALIEEFRTKQIYSFLRTSYFELLEPALSLALDNNIDIDYQKLFVNLIQNEDKRCLFTFFEKFNNQIENLDFTKEQKYTFKFLMASPSDKFKFCTDLFSQNEFFFKFYQDNLVSLSFKELDFDDSQYNYSNMLTNTYIFVKNGLSIESVDNMSLLLLNCMQAHAEDTIETQRRDFYDSVYRSEDRKFSADLSEIFKGQLLDLLKQTFLMYQKQGAMNSEFLEKYKENLDYFKELGLDYSYYDKNGYYHEGNFILNAEKAILENQIKESQVSKKIKI